MTNDTTPTPIGVDAPSWRAAANLALNALHECIVPKGAEAQVSDAMRALRSAIDAAALASAAQPADFDEDRAMRAQAAPAAVAGPKEAVAYLDIGEGGYLDLGTDLSDEALRKLPKGRHMLAIVGTYGVDGYAPVAAPTTQPEQVAQGDAEDAARYRWLREGNDAKHGAAWHVAVNLYGCEWDAAIDAALAAQAKEGGAA